MPSPENTKDNAPAGTAGGRIVSLDQFRGYAFFGMILVNYLGQFDAMPWQFKHHDAGMSYADTIAPLFIFVAGMGARFSFQRRLANGTKWRVYANALRRYLVLILVGIVLYGPAPGNWRYWWDALVDIGFAGILALPVLRSGILARSGAAALYLALYQSCFSLTGYGTWTAANSIDGGPLGVFPWAAIFLFGTVLQDLAATREQRRILLGSLAWGAALCAAGWLSHLEWPGIKAAWPFSQRGMAISYPLFAGGLCFLTYLPFYVLCDLKRLPLPHLTVFGMNPLVLYLVQQALTEMYGPLVVAADANAWTALLGFIFFYFVCYAVALKLYRDKVIIKL